MLANLLMSKWGAGGFMFVLGMLVVFLGMLIIVFFVSMTGKIMKARDKRADAKANASKKTEEPVAEVATPVVDGDIPEDVRVAIVAAIAAYYESEQPQNSFVVRKIKKLR